MSNLKKFSEFTGFYDKNNTPLFVGDSINNWSPYTEHITSGVIVIDLPNTKNKWVDPEDLSKPKIWYESIGVNGVYDLLHAINSSRLEKIYV